MALEDFESSFERQLDLSDRERIGVVIDSFAVSDRFVGFSYSLVAKVISHQEVHRDNFIKTFTSLWRGSDEVSIKEIVSNRFWVRFVWVLATVSDEDYEATDMASSPYKHRQRREALSCSPGMGTNFCYRTTDESRQCGNEHMDVEGASLGLLEVVIPTVSSTSPEFVTDNCLASKLVTMEVGPQEDMPTVLMAPQLPKGISTLLTLDLNQTFHMETDVDPVESVLHVTPTGDETNAYIALTGDPFNFMPIIE
ncbi:hypothetical protein ACE6H2_001909 [Prunus campanulata]